MKTQVIMQVRTGSSRLHRKALLPVGNYPSAVIAALRASNSGHEFVVATSTDSSDDVLVATLQSYGIRVVRGDLEDVLARYAQAAADLSEESAIVRLTGDNLLPDGDFVSELIASFGDAGVEYLSQNFPQSGLPYGVVGEIFMATTLRKAHAAATSAYDREHVTPWIIRNCRTAMHRPRALGGSDYSHLRCTIDDEEDYQRICRLFEGVADPLRAGWFELVKRLAVSSNEPAFRVPYRMVAGRVHSELTLGTAQLGMKYGIMNRSGQPFRDLAIKIIRRAIAHGVTTLDTARGYGDAEQVLGNALAGAWRFRVEVITKLSPLGSKAEPTDVEAELDRSVAQSCQALGTRTIGTLLLHRAHHYSAWSGAVWHRLLQLRAEGKISRLGVSVYEPHEALELLEDTDVQHLQIPMNVLDWRWHASGLDRALANRPDIIVHARSALLQGLLTAPAESWPPLGDYNSSVCAQEIRRLAIEFGREGVADLCLAYVRSQPWIHSVVVGCEKLEQLDENLRLFRLPKLSAEQCSELEHSLPRAPKTLLNPTQWKFA